MALFKTPNGTEIETDDPSTINDYRHRQGWEEVEESKSRSSKRKSESKSDE